LNEPVSLSRTYSGESAQGIEDIEEKVGIDLVPKGLQLCPDGSKFCFLGLAPCLFDLFLFRNVIKDALDVEYPSLLILVGPGIYGSCPLRPIPPTKDDLKIFNCSLCPKELQ
jgi:hypothetical protein